jgi:two-component system sensor histidine kinase MtrB
VQKVIPTNRFRWRLTVAFVAVAAVSAGVLAIGSYVVVRQHRESAQHRRSMKEARLSFDVARDNVRSRVNAEQMNALFTELNRRTGLEAIIYVAGPRVFSSDSAIGDGAIPDDVRLAVRSGARSDGHAAVDAIPYLVIGDRITRPRTEMYLFYSQMALTSSLADLRNVLVGAWIVVVVVAAIVGSALARRTLAPVAQASHAARSLAEGLLDTRMSVQTEDEFGLLATSFNEMAQALETKINELSAARERERRFTSDVSHELRTPLTALVNEASLLKEHLDRLPEEARRPAQLLVQDVTRLRDLVIDIMEVSRFDSGRATLQLEEAHVVELVMQVLKRNEWQSDVVVDGQEIAVQTDRRRLERIMRNLVANAVEHGGSSVHVAVGRTADHWSIAVSDGGPGIASRHLPHIFERFYKVDAARAGSGSGLGLAIALENAKLLGGDITVISQPGRGSTFTCRLPRQPSAAAEGPTE